MTAPETTTAASTDSTASATRATRATDAARAIRADAAGSAVTDVARPAYRDGRLLAYVAGRTVSDLGDQVWFVALAYAAAGLGDSLSAALVMAAGTVPRALLMLFGGAIADRLDSRRLMISTDAARIVVLILGVVALLASPQLGVLVTVAVAFGVADALHGPASAAFPRQLVTPAQLTGAAGLRQLGRRIAALAGAPLGGIVVASTQLRGAMLVDAATFAVVLVTLVLVHPRYPRPPSDGGGILLELRAGWRYVRRESHVRHLLIALSGLNVFVSPVTAIGLALRVTAGHWGAPVLGLLLGLLGAGAAAGTLLMIVWRPRRPLFAAQAVLLVQAGCLAAVGMAPLSGLVVVAGVLGITAGVASPLLSGAFQATVDSAYLGRTSSMLSLADDGLAPLALAGFGALAAVTSVGWACVACGTGMALLMLAGMSRRELRTLTLDTG